MKTYNRFISEKNEKLDIENLPKELFISKYVNKDVIKIIEQLVNELGYDETVRHLGRGCYGYAFKIGQDKVIKLTTDHNEYINACKLMDVDTKHIAKFYDSRRIIIKDGSGWFKKILNSIFDTFFTNDTLYCIVLEYYKELNDDWQLFFDEIIANFKQLKKYKNREYSYDDLKDIIPEDDNHKFIKIYNDLLAIYNESEKYGIPVADLHSGNIGFDKTGTIRRFDLGVDCNDLTSYETREPIKIII